MPFLFTPLAPLEAARIFIEKFDKPACLLVAVSGGSDSTGLLLALHETVQTSARDITLHAITIDHALRAESAEEASAVAGLCARFGIPHHTRRWDGEKPTTGVSAAARLARYSLIGDVAAKIGADAVILGHTHGDQQETIAMRGSRSVRSDNLGLAGMADAVLYRSHHWVLRPFLCVKREDIRDYLEGRNEAWIDDPSNDDAKYERVRTRQKLEAEPYEREASDARAALSRQAAEWIGAHTSAYSQLLIRLDPAGLAEDAAVLRYALSALASVLGGRSFGLSSQSMDRVMTFLVSGTLGRMTASRVVFDRRSSGLYLYRENRNIEVLTLAAGDSGIWDGRFVVKNELLRDVLINGCVEGEGTSKFPATLPRGVVSRVLQSAPSIEDDGFRGFALNKDGISVRALLAPYDLFLPRFDLELANRIAALLEREPYPQPPV